MINTVTKYLYLLRLFVGLNIISLIGTACASVATATPYEVKPTQSARSTEIQPTKSLTVRSSPTKAPTMMPTWTPLSTLSSDQATIRIQEWLQGSPDCRLPCWGGITPGITTWEEAKQILNAVVFFGNPQNNIECVFGPCNFIEWHSRAATIYDGTINGEISSQSDNLIHWIIVKIGKPLSITRLDTILTQYGSPERVFISTSTFLQSPDNFILELTLAYPEYPFIITYTWEARQAGNNVVGCIQDGISVGLRIKPTTETWTDDVIKNLVYGHTDIDAIVFRRLEDVTYITVDEFYNTFRTIEGGECIRTPIKYWP